MSRVDAAEIMDVALSQARLALTHDDVPVGAVIVGPTGEIVAARHNEREKTGDPTAHAEVLALRDAAKVKGTWRLANHTLVVTLEPCVMCAGAAQQARIEHVAFGATDVKGGALGSLYNVGEDPRFAHEFAVTMGVRQRECAALLSSFFAERR